MPSLSLTDVEQMVHLLAQAADPTVELSVPDRKRLLLDGVGQLIDADIWAWSTAIVKSTPPFDAMTTCFIDGGFRDEKERTTFYERLIEPSVGLVMQRRLVDIMRDQKPITLPIQEYVEDELWHGQAGQTWRASGFHHCLISNYPISETVLSGIGFHRRAGRPDFTERDQMIVHVIFQQVDWLHRHGTDVPASGKVLNLSVRERQVLFLILGGDSRKDIARQLELSEHTVGDYFKSIYKRFEVSSRAELLSHFITGGKR